MDKRKLKINTILITIHINQITRNKIIHPGRNNKHIKIQTNLTKKTNPSSFKIGNILKNSNNNSTNYKSNIRIIIRKIN